MKLCKEMMEAMGGPESSYYVQFRRYACEAYNILRKNADLILSLFHLMAGASIEAIRQDPEKAVLKVRPCRCIAAFPSLNPHAAGVAVFEVLCFVLFVWTKLAESCHVYHTCVRISPAVRTQVSRCALQGVRLRPVLCCIQQPLPFSLPNVLLLQAVMPVSLVATSSWMRHLGQCRMCACVTLTDELTN